MAKDKQQPTEHDTCPNCGYCPHCGRAAQPERVVYVPVPYYQPAFTPAPVYPGWRGIMPPVMSGGTISIGVSDGSIYSVN